MATTSFYIQKKGIASIFIQFSIARGQVYRRKTGFTIHSDNWSDKKKLPKDVDENTTILKTDLKKLETAIEENYNKDYKQGIEINGDWLQDQINIFNNISPKIELDLLLNYIDYYIKRLPNKVIRKGREQQKGVTDTTIRRYNAFRSKVEKYQKHLRKPIYVRDVSPKFAEDFILYFKDIEKLNDNTIGREVKRFKTICFDAQKNDIPVHPKFELIQGFYTPAMITYLDFNELQQIKNHVFDREGLDNARDWLIIGCFIGQREGDLLNLTKDNVKQYTNMKVIELTQRKTKKRVAVPLYEEVQAILDKRNGDFPRKISEQKFNEYIKLVAEQAGINDIIEGGRMNPETKRKEYGNFPKHQLVTSHICRRSFATNFYGRIPTSILKDITGHSTEKQFLDYIAKEPIDMAKEIAQYFNIAMQKVRDELKEETKLSIVNRKAK